MTKKDFIKIADEIRPVVDDGNGEYAPMLAALMNVFKKINGSFKASRWMSYLNGECGPSGGKRKR